jgi:hypothetical protein
MNEQHLQNMSERLISTTEQTCTVHILFDQTACLIDVNVSAYKDPASYLENLISLPSFYV